MIEGLQERPFSINTVDGVFAGTRYSIDKLYWNYGHAMLQIQKATVSMLIGPNYLLYSGGPGPDYSVRPHLNNVRLAAITRAPKSLTVPEACALLKQLDHFSLDTQGGAGAQCAPAL